MSNHKSINQFSRTVIGDIAKQSGVSSATVSRVLRGHKDVAPATRNKVLHFINESGYTRSRSNHTAISRVGLSVPMFNSYFGHMLEGTFEALRSREAQFIMVSTQNVHDDEVTQVQHLLDQNISGIIFILPQQSATELLQLQKQGLRLVVVDPFVALPDEIPTIMVEDISASVLVVEHLLSLGHRRIGVIAGPPHWGPTINRIRGYYAALTSAGISIDPTLIGEGRWTMESGEEVSRHLLSLPDPPSAIFALNDDMAIGAMHAILKSGRRIPDDISVVGFDDAAATLPYMLPALTTVHHPLVEIGRLSVDVLYRLLQNQPLDATHIKLSARLVVRESTGPCKEV